MTSGTGARTAFSAGARLWWGLPALIVLLWAGGALSSLGFPGLPVPPDITLWALPIARYARDVAAMLTIGSLLVAVIGPGTARLRASRWATWWALGWLVTLGALVPLTLSDVFAVSPVEVSRTSMLWTLVVDVPTGRVLAAQVVGAALVAVCAGLVRSAGGRVALLAVAVAVAATPAFTGHAGMASAHAAATVSLALHIASVSVWVGGLAAVVAYVAIDRHTAALLIPRFSAIALWCVLVAAETGLLNASLRVGTATALVGTYYGTLVLAKAILLAGLIRLGWLQRRRVLPAIAAGSDMSTARLARLAGYEMVIMAVAIAASVTLARIGPSAYGLSTQPFTPLAVVLVALAAPLLAVACLPSPSAHWLQALTRVPEVAAVILLVVVAEVTGFGALGSVLGPQLGVVAGVALLGAAGWLWATTGTSAPSGIVVVMVAWPAVMWFAASRATIPSPWRPSLLALLVAEALLTYVLWRCLRSSRAADPVHAAVAG